MPNQRLFMSNIIDTLRLHQQAGQLHQKAAKKQKLAEEVAPWSETLLR
jgi:hypothetical protein